MNRSRGFTLIELLVVMTIIVVLASVGMTLYGTSVTRAKEAALSEDLFQMRKAIDEYYADKQKYPPSLDALVSEKYLREIKPDPFTATVDSCGAGNLERQERRARHRVGRPPLFGMVETMFRRISFSLGMLLVVVAASCDKVPLLAPTNSTVTIDAGTRVLPTGGSTTVTATVIESSGTPVQNGTTVRFTTTLGRVDPVEAQTRNGMATTTFFAGDDSGIAEVRATSGGAGGSGTTTTPPSNGNGNGTTTPPTTTTSTSNVVQISVGAGAVDTVTVRANPSTVSTGAGGTVSVIATVVGTGGRLLSGIPVSFSASRGTLSSTSATTDAQGEARVTLTTNGDTDISVAAGAKTATTKVTGVAGPAVSLTCTVGNATNCATASVGQAVIFTAQRAQGSGNLTSAVLDFGDGASVNLGTLSSPATAPHTYTQAGTYTARLTGTDASGESSSTVQVVQVTPVTATLSLSKSGLTVTATATVTGTVTQYQWSWGETPPVVTTTTTVSTSHTYAVAGQYDVVVTATLQGGQTITANATIVVP
jgi:prepilin-type N-terminal cleavage/methylation domain-containing protein